MKYFFLIFNLLVSLNAMSQQEENIEIDSRDYEYYNCYFPNTNINKSSLAFYFGLSLPHTTGTLTDYYKRSWDLTMSLDYYHCNNLTYSLYIMHSSGHLKKDINANNIQWTPNDTLSFTTYGLSVGYSVINTIHWRINPFGGIALVHSELASSNGNK